MSEGIASSASLVVMEKVAPNSHSEGLVRTWGSPTALTGPGLEASPMRRPRRPYLAHVRLLL
eukprot:9397322-Heterocapsa_arctica.AAC.1